MKSVIDRLNDKDPIVKGEAEVEWRKLCKENGADPATAYSEAMLLVAKRAKTDVSKRSRIDFSDIFAPLAPVEKAEVRKDDDDEEDEQDDDTKGKAKDAKPKVVATGPGLKTKDKDGDKDDDGMRAAKDEDGDKDDDGMDASERASRGVARTKSVPGHKSK